MRTALPSSRASSGKRAAKGNLLTERKMLMDRQRACYSYSALTHCADAVKATNWTVRRSAEHFSKRFEVKKLFDLCYDETHCMLFDADFSPWADYLKAVNRKDTKRALDKELHNCYRFLANELNAIAALMRAGEVDSID